MSDLVGTCPKDFWREWIAEGDAAGEPESGEEWGWYTKDRRALRANTGDRLYIVAHGKLRGWAPIVRVDGIDHNFPTRPADLGFAIIRRGAAVACTIPQPIPGFRGLRLPWWDRLAEVPFPEWRTP